MPRTTDLPSSQEINEKSDRKAEQMDSQSDALEKTVEEVETIRDVLAKLEFNGTSDGAEKIEQSVEGAEDATEQIFDQQDRELDETQESNKEFKEEMEGKETSSESDLGKLSDAGGRLENESAVKEFLSAKNEALRQIDILKSVVDRSRQAGEKSDLAQRGFQDRVRRS